MTSTETISVAELEEMLSDDVPCGGNIFPYTRPCPDSAPAVMVSTHRCINGLDEKDFKCLKCYQVWATAVMVLGPFVSCPKCMRTLEVFGLYRPL